MIRQHVADGCILQGVRTGLYPTLLTANIAACRRRCEHAHNYASNRATNGRSPRELHQLHWPQPQSHSCCDMHAAPFGAPQQTDGGVQPPGILPHQH